MSKEMKIIPELRFPEFANDGEWVKQELENSLDYLQPTPYLVKSTKYDESYKVPVLTAGKSFILGYTDEKEGVFNENLPVIIFDDFTTASKFVDFPFKAKSSAMKILIAKGDTNIKFVYESMQRLNYEVGVHKRHWISVFSKLKIALPNPLEQQKIANCLTSLDDLIEAHNQKLEFLKDHKKGLMQNLFPQNGENIPNLRFPEFENDSSWITTELEIIADISSGGTPSRAKPEYWNGTIPWISTTLIDFNMIEKANEYITSLGLEHSSTKIFPKGTILMAMYGQGKTRGKVAVLNLDAAINQACAAINLKEGMNTNFVFQYLSNRYEEIRSISNQGGQENLSGTLIKKIPISYPDIKSGEQQKIADLLSSLDSIITAQVDKIEQLKANKAGLMQSLFPKYEE